MKNILKIIALILSVYIFRYTWEYYHPYIQTERRKHGR